MSITPFIKFNGNCKEAVEFYADVFDAKPQRILTFADMKGPEAPKISEEEKDFVMFTFLDICGTRVRFSDSTLDETCTIGDNISLSVNTDTPEQTKQYFEKLKKDAKIIMDLQETFFSKSYAYLEDKFGISWQLNCEKEH